MKQGLLLLACVLSQLAHAQTANALFGSDTSLAHLYSEGRHFAKKADGQIYYGVVCPDKGAYFGILDTLQAVGPGTYKSAFREIREVGGTLRVHEPFWHRPKLRHRVLRPATLEDAAYFRRACQTDSFYGPTARATWGTVARTTGCYHN